MRHYTQLSMSERKRYYKLKQHIKSVSEISRIMGRDRSTIYRELKRNLKTEKHLYLPITVNGVSKLRRRNRARKSKVSNENLQWIIAKIKLQWSPDQISKRMKLELGYGISHEWIYQYIYKDKKAGGELYKNLRWGHKKRKKRNYISRDSSTFKELKSIENRPKIVEKRERLGDLEGDLIIGAYHQQAIVTAVDRVSLLTRIKKVENKTAMKVREVLIELLEKFSGYKLSLTLDNGKEFADFKIIESRSNIEIYFAHPYSSYERGTNENTNGLIRQYFPKKTSFENLTDTEIQKVEDLLNNRPRKKLGYRTPNEVHYNQPLITKILTLNPVIQ